ncbi:hypothetical protein CHS0354_007179, partial [Potamilus streckersoni]
MHSFPSLTVRDALFLPLSQGRTLSSPFSHWKERTLPPFLTSRDAFFPPLSQ